MFEDIRVRRVAAAAITQQQNRSRVGVTLLPDAVPVPKQTVASKLAGIVRQPDVDVSAIANSVVDSMRDDHAVRPTGKIMIKRPEGRAGTDSPGPEQPAQVFFGLGVHGKTRIPSEFILVDQLRNLHELCIAVRRGAPGQDFVDFPQSQPFVVHPLSNRFVTHGRPQLGERFRKLRR